MDASPDSSKSTEKSTEKSTDSHDALEVSSPTNKFVADAIKWVSIPDPVVIDIEETNFIHTDHLGTPRAVTDDAQTVVWRWDSTPFGDSAPNKDPDGDGDDFTLNLRFPGQYYDVESGLYYNYFRTYDPAIGRYIESDPIGLDGGLNTFGYVGGSPVNWWDPLGLKIVGNWEGGVSASASGNIAKILLLDFKVRALTASVSLAEIFVTATGTAKGRVKCTETDDCTGTVLREWELSGSGSVTNSTSFHASVTPLPWWGSLGIMAAANLYEFREYISFINSQKDLAIAALLKVDPTKFCGGS